MPQDVLLLLLIFYSSYIQETAQTNGSGLFQNYLWATEPCWFFLSPQIPPNFLVVSCFCCGWEWGIEDILAIAGICERMDISIITSNSSTSASLLLPSISRCTSACASAPAGRSSTDLTLIFSSLNFSSTIRFTISVNFGFCHESTKISDDCFREMYDTENM